MHHEERHVVSNIVGDPRMRIEMGPTLEMAARDTLLLASDGLFDNLTTGEVVSGMRTGRLASKLKNLTDLALARMAEATKDLPSKPDDLSVIGIRRST
jgi:serine/threonine protein phosphatase PrpC